MLIPWRRALPVGAGRRVSEGEFFRHALVELVGEDRAWVTWVFCGGRWTGIRINGHIACRACVAVVDDDTGEEIALLCVALKAQLAGEFPWLGFVDEAVEVAAEGQFERIRVATMGRGSACALAVGGVGEPAEGMQQGGGCVAVFEQAVDVHGAGTIRADERIHIPDHLDQFAPFLSGNPRNGVLGEFNDFDAVVGLRNGRRRIAVRVGVCGHSLVEGSGARLIGHGFPVFGKIGITATDGGQMGSGRVSRFGCRLCAGAFAPFAACAVAVGTVVADKVLAGGGNVTGDGGNESGRVEGFPQALRGVIALAAVDDFAGLRDIGHLLQREGVTQDVLGQFLKPVVVMPLDAVTGMNVESAVMPFKHLSGLLNRQFFLPDKELEDPCLQQFGDALPIGAGEGVEGVVADECAIGNENVQVRVEVQVIAKGLDGDDDAGLAVGRTETGADHVAQAQPSRMAEVAEQLAIVLKRLAQAFG